MSVYHPVLVFALFVCMLVFKMLAITFEWLMTVLSYFIYVFLVTKRLDGTTSFDFVTFMIDLLFMTFEKTCLEYWDLRTSLKINATY